MLEFHLDRHCTKDESAGWNLRWLKQNCRTEQSNNSAYNSNGDTKSKYKRTACLSIYSSYSGTYFTLHTILEFRTILFMLNMLHCTLHCMFNLTSFCYQSFKNRRSRLGVPDMSRIQKVFIVCYSKHSHLCHCAFTLLHSDTHVKRPHVC